MIVKNLLAGIDTGKHPETEGKIRAFHEKIKSLETMPALEELKKELKDILQLLDTEELKIIIALKENGLRYQGDVVRIPEGWETIIDEILEERKKAFS